jgi:hypothetical protein
MAFGCLNASARLRKMVLVGVFTAFGISTINHTTEIWGMW